MIEEINKKISEAKAKKDERDSVVKALTELEQRIKKIRIASAKIEEDLQNYHSTKKSDWENLKDILLHFISGKGKDKRENEEGYVKLFEKYKQSMKDISAVELEIENCNQQIQALGDVDAELEKAFLEKEKFFIENQNDVSEDLKKVVEESDSLSQKRKLILDAAETGKVFQKALKNVIISLKTVGNWDLYDSHGERPIITAEKHTQIDKVKSSVLELKQILRIFQNKLNVLDDATKSDVAQEIESLASFSNYFFDGFISDWFVQAKIKTSVQDAVMTEDRVRLALKYLDRKMAEYVKQLEILNKKRLEMVENAKQ